MRKDRVIDFYRNSITILDLEAVTGMIDGNPQIRY